MGLRGPLGAEELSVLLDERVQGLAEAETVSHAADAAAIGAKHVNMMPRQIAAQGCIRGKTGILRPAVCQSDKWEQE